MKKGTILMLAGNIVILAVTAVLFAEPVPEQIGEPEHFVIMRASNGEAVVEEKDLPAFGAMEGLDGWSVSLVQFAGTDMYIFKIAPGATEMGIHESPVAWIGYVITGVGEMTLGDKDGNYTGFLEFTMKPTGEKTWRYICAGIPAAGKHDHGCKLLK